METNALTTDFVRWLALTRQHTVEDPWSLTFLFNHWYYSVWLPEHVRIVRQ